MRRGRAWDPRSYKLFTASNRVMVVAAITLPDGTRLTAASTHLATRGDTAAKQLAAAWRTLSHWPGPHLLIGDYNLRSEQLAPLGRKTAKTAPCRLRTIPPAGPGHLPNPRQPEPADWMMRPGISTRPDHPESQVDARRMDAGGLHQGVLPVRLGAPAHHQQLAVSEHQRHFLTTGAMTQAELADGAKA